MADRAKLIIDRGVVAGNVTDKYRATNPIARRLMNRFLETVGGLYDEVGARSVLEIGCGQGDLCNHLQSRLPAQRFVGTDLSPRILDVARSRYATMDLAAQSATELGFANNSFDLVIACEVLEHLPDPLAALQEIARVARRSVILSVPSEPLWRVLNMARGAYISDLGNTPGHLQHWSRRGFVHFVSAKLRIDRVCSPLPWTVVAASVAR